MATRQSTPKLKTPLTHSVNNTVASSIETHALATPITNQETSNLREEITTELITPIVTQETSTLRQALVSSSFATPMLLPSVNGTYTDPYDPDSIRFINNKCVYTCTGLCCAFDSALAPYQTQLLLSPVNINGTLATTVEQALHMINTARTQVNADWNASSGITAICNKPVLASVATLGTYNSLIDKPNLAEVACSGCYCDLCGLPTIPAAQVNSDWLATEGVALICNKPSLSCVACSGDYNDLLNTPDLCLIQQQSDWNQANSDCTTYIKNKPELARVATSGLYADLLGAPSIPEQVNSDWLALSGPAYICNKPSLSEVAISGDYNDLRNIPPDTSKTYTFSFDESTHKLAVTEHGLFGDTLIFNDTIDTAYSFEYEDNTLTITDNRNNTYTISLGTDFYTKGEVDCLISAITDLIPEQASPTNQLADKCFVNSSIATNTANFVGTFNNLACLCATCATPNDYAFYAHCDTCGNCVYDRYKYNASCVWVCEYTLNNSSFTANQWAAINSGITDTAVAKITDVYNCTVQLCNADGTTLLGSFTLNQNQNTCICLSVGGGTVTGINVYCGSSCVCTVDDSTALCLSNNAFNEYAQISTTTYPGACCTGDVSASSLATVATSGNYNDLTGAPSLATVATSGKYCDLTGKPTIPAAQVNSDWNATTGVAAILNKPSLATVATSGKYCDLTGTPTIPAAANNGKITLCVNSTCVCSFTVNQSSNTDITLPAYPPDLSSCAGLDCTGTLVPSDLNGYATETWVTNKNYCTHDCLVKLSLLCSDIDRRVLFSAQENGCICPVYASNGVSFTYNACCGDLKIGDFSCVCCNRVLLSCGSGLVKNGPKGSQTNAFIIYKEWDCLNNCSIGVGIGSGNINRGFFDYCKASETATFPTFRWLQYWDSSNEIHALPIWGELGANNKVVYSCTLAQPLNTRRYVLVCFDKTCCGNPSSTSACFEIDIYTSKYFIWTDTCTIRSYWVNNGLNPNASIYGSFCYGTPYTCNSNCFWITYSGYRSPVMKGARKVTILCTTTTAPEGITFCVPTDRNSYIDVYCDTTCIGTLQGPSSLCLGCNAFSNEAFTTMEAIDACGYLANCLATNIKVNGSNKTTVLYTINTLDNTYPKKTYQVNCSTAHCRYIYLGKLPVSNDVVSYASLTMYLFSYNCQITQSYPIGTIQIDVSSGASCTAFNIRGWSDIPLNSATSALGSPRLYVTKDATCGYYCLYLDDTYAYLKPKVQINQNSNFTVGDFSASSTMSGTSYWDSVSCNDIVYLNKINRFNIDTDGNICCAGFICGCGGSLVNCVFTKANNTVSTSSGHPVWRLIYDVTAWWNCAGSSSSNTSARGIVGRLEAYRNNGYGISALVDIEAWTNYGRGNITNPLNCSVLKLTYCYKGSNIVQPYIIKNVTADGDKYYLALKQCSYANVPIRFDGLSYSGKWLTTQVCGVDADGTLPACWSIAISPVQCSAATLDLYTTTPFIDFHAGNMTCHYTHRIIANPGHSTTTYGNLQFLTNCVSYNPTTSVYTCTQGCNFYMYPNGMFQTMKGAYFGSNSADTCSLVTIDCSSQYSIRINKVSGADKGILLTTANNCLDYCSLGIEIGSGNVNRGFFDYYKASETATSPSFRWLLYANADTWTSALQCFQIGSGRATESAGIIYGKGTCATCPVIRFLNNTSATDGNGYLIYAGGIGILGAGEGAGNVWCSINGSTNLYGACAGQERLYLTSNGSIYFYTCTQCNDPTTWHCSYIDSSGNYYGNVCGNASSSDCSTYTDCALVSLTNKDSTRPTDANCEGFVDTCHIGAMNVFLATSSMTNNKPTNDSYITQWNWDSCYYKAQMAIPTNPVNTIQMRFKCAGTWCAWANMGCYIGTVKNSDRFGGCTYACAKADIRDGLVTTTDLNSCGYITDIGVNVYCGTTCKCTLCKSSSLCLGSNAFNSTAFTTCTGTVTVSDNNGSTALPIALCTGAKSIGKSSCCSLTFTPSTGTLCVDTVCAAAYNLVGCAYALACDVPSQWHSITMPASIDCTNCVMICAYVPSGSASSSISNIWVCACDTGHYALNTNGLGVEYRHVGPTVTEFVVRVGSTYSQCFYVPGFWWVCCTGSGQTTRMTPQWYAGGYYPLSYWACPTNVIPVNLKEQIVHQSLYLFAIMFNCAFCIGTAPCVCAYATGCSYGRSCYYFQVNSSCTICYNVSCYGQCCIDKYFPTSVWCTVCITQPGFGYTEINQEGRCNMRNYMPFYGRYACDCSVTDSAMSCFVLWPNCTHHFVIYHTYYNCYMC